MLSSRLRAARWCTGAALLMTALCVRVAVAQTSVSVSNSLVTASVGISGSTGTPTVNLAGRVGVDYADGSGTLLTMASSTTAQSYFTLRIDGGPSADGYDLVIGDSENGAWVSEPEVSGKTIVAEWETATIASIGVKMVVRPVRDMVWYKFTITNKDVKSHTVAIRFAQSYAGPLGDTTKTGPITTPLLSQISTESEITGDSIPAWWRVLSKTGAQSVGALIYPTGAAVASDVGISRVAFGTPTHLIVPLWTFTPDTSTDITSGKGSAALYLNPVVLGAGQSRTVNTYFGRQHATMLFGANGTVAGWLDGPVRVTIDATQVAGKQLVPYPMTINAAYSNMNTIDVPEITATLDLPAGLTLQTGDKAQSKTDVKAGGDATFQWKIVADGSAYGHLKYSVFLQAGSNDPGMRVTREVDVPAMPGQFTGTGLKMVTFPYLFTNPEPYTALGLSVSSPPLVRWNENTTGYEVASSLYPGRGYWMDIEETPTLKNANSTDDKTPWYIPLTANSSGWNQIGNPWVYQIKWGEVKVWNQDPLDTEYNTVLSVKDASSSAHKWIKASIWWWDSTEGYQWDTDFSSNLLPYTGYWVKALREHLSLIIPVPTARSASSSNASTRASSTLTSSKNWKTRLIASASGASDKQVYVGVSSSGSDTGEEGAVEKPPAVSGRVSLSSVRTVSGRAVSLAEDLRSGAIGRKVWGIVVTTPRANEDVTISWPEISTVPKAYELFFVDTSTGSRYQMRQRSSVTLNSGVLGTRSAQIVAEPRGTGMFAINGLTVGGGSRRSAATVSFSVSLAADVTVRIRKINGSPVRTVLTRSIAAGAATQVVWDHKDNRGISVPAGAYEIEVKGTASDGQSDRRLVQYVLVR
jgi:hypothetical protein